MKARGLRILLVEDQPDCANSTKLMLDLWGHEVELVPDGPTALQAAQAQHPDVVLLDIGLPGMDGWAVAKLLHDQARGKGPLLVAVTGYGQPGDYGRSYDSGIDVHLLKPVDPDGLRRLLDNWQETLAGPHHALLGPE
jgi:two-component system CheB/CheR fusion protein